jgi:hypothetical protein
MRNVTRESFAKMWAVLAKLGQSKELPLTAKLKTIDLLKIAKEMSLHPDGASYTIGGAILYELKEIAHLLTAVEIGIMSPIIKEFGGIDERSNTGPTSGNQGNT